MVKTKQREIYAMKDGQVRGLVSCVCVFESFVKRDLSSPWVRLKIGNFVVSLSNGLGGTAKQNLFEQFSWRWEETKHTPRLPNKQTILETYYQTQTTHITFPKSTPA